MTRVRIVSSNGTVIAEREVGDLTPLPHTITLTESEEVDVWSEVSGRLARDLAHLDALRSGEIHWSSDDPTPRLKDGTPVKL